MTAPARGPTGERSINVFDRAAWNSPKKASAHQVALQPLGFGARRNAPHPSLSLSLFKPTTVLSQHIIDNHAH